MLSSTAKCYSAVLHFLNKSLKLLHYYYIFLIPVFLNIWNFWVGSHLEIIYLCLFSQTKALLIIS